MEAGSVCGKDSTALRRLNILNRSDPNCRRRGDFGQNAVDVLHHFPLLEEIGFLDAQRLADQLKTYSREERKHRLNDDSDTD